MITETGENLSILIVTETGMDWQTFATWYSFYKNLPEAKVSIICHRNGQTPFVYFQWTKRCNLRVIRDWPFESESTSANWLAAVKRANLTGTVLAVKPYVMALEPFDPKTLERLNEAVWLEDEDVCFMKSPNVDSLLNRYLLEGIITEKVDEPLCYDVKDTESMRCLVNYKKGCGKWIDTAKGCPFSSAAGHVSTGMTANEHMVIELWKRMVPLYGAVA